MLCLCLDFRMYQDKLASLKRQLQQLQEGDWKYIYSLFKLLLLLFLEMHNSFWSRAL